LANFNSKKIEGFKGMNKDNSDVKEAVTETLEDVKQEYSRSQVSEIIKTVVEKMDGGHVSVDFHGQLRSLINFIETARAEIAQTRPAQIGDEHIPTATDELDAVVGATEEATGTIMDACDLIEQQANQCDDKAVQDNLMMAVTNIYEACSFQDITGQRITKVVQTLKKIEDQVNALLGALGEYPEEQGGESVSALKEAVLENGPQMPGQGVDQTEIDRLLASFD
jgi:chemotaxis protein CheZ